MKYLFLLLIVFSSLYSQSQEYKVIDANGMSATDLRVAIKSWIADSFKSAKNVIEIDEPNKIIIKGLDRFDVAYRFGGEQKYISAVLNFKVDFEIKDNRFRYKMDDIVIDSEDHKIPYDGYVDFVEKKNAQTMKDWVLLKKSRQNLIDARNKTIGIVDNTLYSLMRSIERIPDKKPDDEW